MAGRVVSARLLVHAGLTASEILENISVLQALARVAGGKRHDSFYVLQAEDNTALEADGVLIANVADDVPVPAEEGGLGNGHFAEV